MQVFSKMTGGLSVQWRALALALLFGGAFASASVAADGPSASARIDRLESGASALQTKLDALAGTLSALVPPRPIGVSDAAPVQVAQAQNAAALAVRLGQVEEEMRTINGQVQGLQFQLTQLQTLIQRMQEDTDARFTALEGGVSPGKNKAAPRAGGATPAGEAPQSTDLSAPDQNSGGANGAGSTNPSDAPIDLNAPIELGTPPHPLGTLKLDNLSGAAATTGGEVDIGQDASLVTDADADAQYKAGYDAVIKGDYAFAEEQFRQFISLFPDHPKAPDATNWLGEALIQRGQYEDAANILLNGFQLYSKSARAPDILMKLGVALAGTGETDTACRTFGEVLKRYPNVSPAFRQRLAQEEKKAKC